MSSKKPTTPDQFSNLVHMLRHRAEADPDSKRIRFLLDGEAEEEFYSYRRLDQMARTIGSYLQKSNYSGKQAVLLYPPGLDYIAGFFGCLYGGVVAVPAYPPDPNRLERTLPRLQSIVKDSQSTVVLTTQMIASMAQVLFEQAPDLARLEWIATDTLDASLQYQWQEPKLEKHSLAFLQYTSGSTGQPKGVMLSHGNLLSNLEIIGRGFGLNSEDRGVFWLPPYHDMGLIGGILEPIYHGGPTVLMSPLHFLQKPFRWLQAMSKNQSTISGGPNFAYEMCVAKTTVEQRKSLDLSAWAVAFTGAEPISPQTLERFVEAFGPCGFSPEAFYPCYGLAEGTLMVTGGVRGGGAVRKEISRQSLKGTLIQDLTQSNQDQLTLIACGQSFSGQAVVVANPENSAPCQDNEVGEIWVEGPSVAGGYWNQPDLTQSMFQAKLAGPHEGTFLRTGDLGFLNEGQLFVTGRLKDLIIIRGNNHYPQDIEKTVEDSHPCLRPGCGAAISSNIQGEERLIVIQELEKESYKERENINFQQVVGKIRKEISSRHDLEIYEIFLIKPGEIPKTSSGKISRHSCRTAYQDQSLKPIHHWEKPAGEIPAKSNEAMPASPQWKLREELPVYRNLVKESGPLKSTQVERWMVEKLSQKLGVASEDIDTRVPLNSFGLDSKEMVGLSGELEEWLGRNISPTLLWNYPTIELLAQGLVAEEKQKGQSDGEVSLEREPIAIVGIGCRFPGAEGPDSFWQQLSQGFNGISEVPPDRWPVEEYFNSEPATPGKMNTRKGGFLTGVDRFGADFFGISPREASRMDPQQRLSLEVAWEAIENAGYDPTRLSRSNTGVFLGISSNDYSKFQFEEIDSIDAYAGTGNAHSIAANRISYCLDLRGPSLAVDTACSSSLVAVHQACQSMRLGECDLALAGGVNIILCPDLNVAFSQARMLSPDGICKTFDAKADGYVRGEGCGFVFLKKLSRALEDGDHIWGVIRGSAVNQDGKSNGLTAPNGISQQEVITRALKDAKVTPSEISYVEAHGTGTPLGDPIEMEALGNVLKEGRDPKFPCSVGSVKTNIGHLESAAGIAGLIKTVLALKNEKIPPHIHMDQLNEKISLTESLLKIPTEMTAWPSGKVKRRAGVSSFGFGGTNSHVILEEAPEFPEWNKKEERPLHLLKISAKSNKALRKTCQQYANLLENNKKITVADFCFTANSGRIDDDWRLFLTGPSTKALQEELNKFVAGRSSTARQSRQIHSWKSPKIAFLFSGQGSQYENMGKIFYDTQPTFKRIINECDEIFKEHFNESLLPVLFPKDSNHSLLHETQYTQPALFSLEYALAKVWQSWGVQPDILLGHSVGEYVAACLAGVFPLEVGLKLISRRAKLMQSLPKEGSMWAVIAEEAEVRKRILAYPHEVSIAAINTPRHLVISGKTEKIEALAVEFRQLGWIAQPLKVSHAFHSPLMDPILEEFRNEADKYRYQSPNLPWVSNLTGKIWEADKIPDADYWTRHIRETVRFGDGLKAASNNGAEVFLEIGPHSTLASLGKRCFSGTQHEWLASFQRDQEDWKGMLQSLGRLYLHGVPVEWGAFDADYARRRITIPTYPFERERYWIEALPRLKASVPRKPYPSEFNPGGDPVNFEARIDPKTLGYGGGENFTKNPFVSTAALLEIIFSGAKDVFGEVPRLIQDLIIHNPKLFHGRESLKIQLSILPQSPSEGIFEIHENSEAFEGKDSKLSPWVTGRISRNSHFSDRPHLIKMAPEEIMDRCPQVIEGDSFYQGMVPEVAEPNNKIGVVKKLWQGPGEVLGLIEFGQFFQIENSYHLPPVLFDAAFQIVLDRFGDQGKRGGSKNLQVGLSLGQIKIYSHPIPETYVHIVVKRLHETEGNTLCGDIRFIRADGAIVAEVLDFNIHTTVEKPASVIAGGGDGDWLYDIQWKEQRRSPKGESGLGINDFKPEYWLIFMDSQGVGDRVTEELRKRDYSVIQVYPGEAFEKKDASKFVMRSEYEEDFASLWNQIAEDGAGSCRGVIHLWSLPKDPEAETSLKSLKEAESLGPVSILHYLHSLPKRSESNWPPLWILTQGAQSIGGSDSSLNLEGSSLWGLGKVIPLEYPDMPCRRIDLPPEGFSDDWTLLLEDVLNPDPEDQIAYRNGKRYVARLVPASIVETKEVSRHSIPSELGFREGDNLFYPEKTYLITGGLGGLGLRLARWMIEKGAGHLVLMARREPQESAVQVLNRLKKEGHTVRVVRGDVANPKQLGTILTEIKKDMPPLGGIIHAAGVLNDGVLANQNGEQFKSVLAPKIQGAWNLHTLTREMPLDFFVLFSSIASLLGSPGQGNYAAGNAFLDTLAYYRTKFGLPALSVNWGPWAEDGMAMQVKGLRSLHNLGMEMIIPSFGMKVLENLIREGKTQQAVFALDWSKLLKSLPNPEPKFLSHFIPKELSRRNSLSKNPSAGSLLEKMAGMKPESKQIFVQDYIRSRIAHILRMEKEKLDLERPLNDFGLDSLMAIELKNEVEISLGVSLPINISMKGLSISQLVNNLLSKMEVGGANKPINLLPSTT